MNKIKELLTSQDYAIDTLQLEIMTLHCQRKKDFLQIHLSRLKRIRTFLETLHNLLKIFS